MLITGKDSGFGFDLIEDIDAADLSQIAIVNPESTRSKFYNK